MGEKKKKKNEAHSSNTIQTEEIIYACVECLGTYFGKVCV